MLRILWNQCETALLIDTWLAIEREQVSRKERVSKLSRALRERAVSNGITIDETYRNENGISMQLNNIDRLMRGVPEAKRHNTKIFIDMAEMYFSDRSQFDAILQEAKEGSGQMMSNQELFANWLSANVSSNRLSDCFMAITEVEAFAKKKRIITSPIYDVSDSSITAKIVNAINSDRLFRFTHKKQIRNIVEAAQLYHIYTKENQIEQSFKPEPQVQPAVTEPVVEIKEPETTLPIREMPVTTENPDLAAGHKTEEPANNYIELKHSEDFEGTILIDFEHDTDFAFTKPVSVSYFGDTVPVTSWRKLYVKVCEILIEDYPNIFEELRVSATSEDRKYLVYDEETSKRLTTPACIAVGYYVETNRSASDLIRNIKSLLDSCRVDYENVEIRYRKSTEQKTDVTVDDVAQKEPNRGAEILDDPIISYLEEIELPYVDLRDKMGCLWIIGGMEISEKIKPLQGSGVNLYFKSGGGNATAGRDAWWTKDKPESLQIEVRRVSDSDTKANFTNWLIQDGLAERTAFGYTSAVTVTDEYARKHGFSSESLYDLSDEKAVSDIWNRLRADSAFAAYNREQHNRFSAAMRKYIEFCGSNQEGASGNPAQSNSEGLRAEFEAWLVRSGVNCYTAQNRALAVSTLGELAEKYEVSATPFYQIADGKELRKIWERLKANTHFQDYLQSHSRRYPVAFRYYIRFLDERSNKVRAAIGSNRANMLIQKKHPAQAEFEEWLVVNKTPEGSVQTYSSSVKRIGDYLLETKQEDRHVFSIFGIARLEDIQQKLQSDLTYDGTSGKFNSLDLYALRKYISFRKNAPSDAVDEEICGKYSTVLRENFDNGYRINSMIDRNRFKQYYLELYGIDLQQDDDKLVETIQQVGQIQDDRVFVRDGGTQSDLLDDIQEAIAKAFNQGASCVFVSAVFERYQNELAAQLQIYSDDVLCQQLLDTCYGFYRLARNYFHIKGRVSNADEDVANVMKHSQLPLNYQQIHEILWYIPLDLIKHSLIVTSDIVNVAQETYFYARNLPISVTEQGQIAEIIHAQLAQKAFITDAELCSLIEKRCPSVAINTEGFTTWGFRNALAVLLRDRFSFNGAIISECGQEINMTQAFESFCESHEEMTSEELRGFAKEMNNTPIYWDAVFNKMLRISQTEFIQKSAVQFPVEEMDAALDMLLEGDYIPIRKFSLFLHFPPISVKWNEFVLEGYVAQYSRDFGLLHASYTANECYGAIVRRSSTIKDFKGLVVDVLAHADEWKTQDDALALLVRKGYLQRKRYSEIGAAITEARLMKDRSSKDEFMR